MSVNISLPVQPPPHEGLNIDIVAPSETTLMYGAIIFSVDGFTLKALAGHFDEDATVALPDSLTLRCPGETITRRDSDGRQRTQVICPGAVLKVNLGSEEIVRPRESPEGQPATHTAASQPETVAVSAERAFAHLITRAAVMIQQHRTDWH